MNSLPTSLGYPSFFLLLVLPALLRAQEDPPFRTPYAEDGLWQPLLSSQSSHPVSPDMIQEMEWSAALSRIYVGYHGGQLWEWDPKSRQRLARLPDLSPWNLSPDGRLLAGVSLAKVPGAPATLKIWNLETGVLSFSQPIREAEVTGIEFDPMGDQLFFLTFNNKPEISGSLKRWRHTLFRIPLSDPSSAASTAFTTESKENARLILNRRNQVVCIAEDVKLFEASTLSPISAPDVAQFYESSADRHLVESPRGRYLGALNMETLMVVDTRTPLPNLLELLLQGPTATPPGSVVYSEAAEILSNGLPLASSTYSSLVFAPDESWAAVGRMGSFTILSLPNAKIIRTVQIPVSVLVASSNSRILTVANGTGLIHFDPKTGAQLAQSPGSNAFGAIVQFSLSHDGRFLFLNRESVAEVWDLETRRQVHRIDAESAPIRHGLLLPDAAGLIYTTDRELRQLALNPAVSHVNSASSKVLRTVEGVPSHAYLTPALAPDGQTVALAAGDQLWVGRLGSPEWRTLYVRTESGAGMDWMEFSPDGAHLFYHHSGNGLVHHDIASDSAVEQDVTESTINPDRTKAVTFDHGGTLTIHPTQLGGAAAEKIRLPTIDGQQPVSAWRFAFAPDGKEVLAVVHPMMHTESPYLFFVGLEQPHEIRRLPLRRIPAGLAISGEDRVLQVQEKTVEIASLQALRAAAEVQALTPAPASPTGPASGLMARSPAAAPPNKDAIPSTSLVTWDPLELTAWLSFSSLDRSYDGNATGNIVASLFEPGRVVLIYQCVSCSGAVAFDLADAGKPKPLAISPLPGAASAVFSQPGQALTVRMGFFSAPLDQLNDRGALSSSPDGPELVFTGGLARLDPTSLTWHEESWPALEGLRGLRRIGDKYYGYADEHDALPSGCGVWEIDPATGSSRPILTNRPAGTPRNVWESQPKFWVQGVMPSGPGRLAVALSSSGLLHEIDLESGECWPILNFPSSGMPPFLPEDMHWTPQWAWTFDNHEPGNITAVAVNRATGEWKLLLRGRPKGQINPNARSPFQGTAGRLIDSSSPAAYLLPAPANTEGGDTGIWYDGKQLFALAPETGPAGEAYLYWWNEHTPADRPVRIPIRSKVYELHGVGYEPAVRAIDRDLEVNRGLRRIHLTPDALYFEGGLKGAVYIPRTVFDRYVDSQVAAHGWTR